jgi:small basic protein (TIGR04137 family)
MTIDKSLVSRGRLTRHRNVLSRAERIFLLEEQEKWKEGLSAFGLPKVRNIKVKQRKAAKAEKEAVPVEGAEAAAPVEGAAPEAAKGAAAAAKPEKGAAAPKAAEKAAKPEKGAKPEKAAKAEKK